MAIQTIVLVVQQARVGSFTSPSFSIPVGVLNLKLTANILLSDKLQTGLTCDIDIQHSSDGELTWNSAVGFGWTSYGAAGYHTIDRNGNAIDNPDPSLSFSPSAYIGQKFRIIISIPVSLNVGASVDITT